ncbi:hypothetical protein [Paraclostridium sp. AKS81]|uniref:hypothetical protein n=1 Tax=Paraclostridium sp. AKS81 TaxID=2876117 RepID=UPI0021E0F8F3|nr:hypothetical protein [Paraclostridium sp. AKS81]MCU9813609.1 hypothetical protein [Paraclostridium sp. AKS81]
MKKYDEFDLDLKNEDTKNVQLMTRSLLPLSIHHNCGKDTSKYNGRTVNTCRTV